MMKDENYTVSYRNLYCFFTMYFGYFGYFRSFIFIFFLIKSKAKPFLYVSEVIFTSFITKKNNKHLAKEQDRLQLYNYRQDKAGTGHMLHNRKI